MQTSTSLNFLEFASPWRSWQAIHQIPNTAVIVVYCAKDSEPVAVGWDAFKLLYLCSSSTVEYGYQLPFLHRQQWMFENYLGTTWLSLSVSSFFQFFWVTNNFHFFSITTWLVNFRVLRISIPVRINYSRIGKLVCLWIKYVYCFFFFLSIFLGEIFCPILLNPFIIHHPLFLFGSVFTSCKLKYTFWGNS